MVIPAASTAVNTAINVIIIMLWKLTTFLQCNEPAGPVAMCESKFDTPFFLINVIHLDFESMCRPAVGFVKVASKGGNLFGLFVVCVYQKFCGRVLLQ
uniref:Uncharacterized protein n=1 Tax=Solanum tuberosum TaxID=4113 RepID=M0ZYT2_SOLTU